MKTINSCKIIYVNKMLQSVRRTWCWFETKGPKVAALSSYTRCMASSTEIIFRQLRWRRWNLNCLKTIFFFNIIGRAKIQNSMMIH